MHAAYLCSSPCLRCLITYMATIVISDLDAEDSAACSARLQPCIQHVERCRRLQSCMLPSSSNLASPPLRFSLDISKTFPLQLAPPWTSHHAPSHCTKQHAIQDPIPPPHLRFLPDILSDIERWHPLNRGEVLGQAAAHTHKSHGLDAPHQNLIISTPDNCGFPLFDLSLFREKINKSF